MSEVKFILPSFTCLGRNEIFINIFKKHRELLRYDNANIYSFYGTFPRAIWNGGRPDLQEKESTVSFMKKVRDFYNKNGIVITFTFTNSQLKEEHLHDEYCNTILEIFDNGMNEVLVASDLLENYIRLNYPKYKINRSITASHDKEYDLDRYTLTVIDKKYNRDFDYLSKIENKDKIEILCDEVCVNDCPYTKTHYKEISLVQLGAERKGCFGKCRFAPKIPSYAFTKLRNQNSKYYISPIDLKKYADMGFKYFKLSGREKYSMIGFESLIDYIIKPEYQDDVRVFIMERMLLESQKESSYYLRVDSMYSPAIDERGWKYV